MAEEAKPIKRALISVSNKTGLVDLCTSLVNDFGIEIISTGGTLKVLLGAKLKATEISSYTGFPEMMDGRVKTLHPKVHGGILARRGQDEKIMEENGILPIDLVVVNLYPFVEKVSKENVTLETALENIDIGGPSMVRSAAKNHKYVSILTNPEQYGIFIEALSDNTVDELKPQLALEAFKHTAEYDKAISTWMGNYGKV